MSTTVSETDGMVDNPNEDGGGAEYKIASLSFVERFSDWMNPILVKETRQAMKSRAFVITFLVLILTCWLIAVIGALSVGAALEYYSYADRFFASFFIPLAITIGVVVPFLAYFSLLNEQTDDTFEMLSITTLNARRIISGKLTNAIALVLLCFAAITPFISFTSLMQGFNLTPVLVTLTAALFGSVTLCAISIFVSTIARNRVMQGLFALGLLFFLGYSTAAGCALLYTPFFWSMRFDWAVVAVLAGCCCGSVLMVLFLREVAVAKITFESDNRATGVRLMTTLVGLGMMLATYIVIRVATSTGAPGTPAEMFWRAFPTVSICFLLLVGLVSYFSCTEPLEMSSRVKQQVTSLPWLVRLVAAPWLPGCYRGYLFSLIHIVPIVILCHILWSNYVAGYSSASWTYDPGYDAPYALETGLYLLVYLGLAAAVSSVMYGRNPRMRTLVVRSTFLLVACSLICVPHLIIVVMEQVNDRLYPYGMHLITSPVATIYASTDFASPIGGKNLILTVTYFLGIAAGLLFLFQLPSIIGSIRDTIWPLANDSNGDVAEEASASELVAKRDLAEPDKKGAE